MNWVKGKLYKQIRTQNSIGQYKTVWEEIQDIDIIISTNLYSTVTADAVYRKFASVAICKYKGFEKDKTYRVVQDSVNYSVDSFNIEGRYAQLTLSEVIQNV